MTKYYVWGLGAVGYSFLKKVAGLPLFDPDSFYCVEPNINRKQLFLELGGKEEHFILDNINTENCLDFLKKLNKGDYLLDFATDLKTLYIVEYCLKHGIHYLFTADGSWNPDPEWISVHQHFLEYVKLKGEHSENEATSVVAFGMNPGLVSCFVKQCIREIVYKDESPYVQKNRKKLKDLLNKNEFALVAKMLEITHIQEVDNDDQEVSFGYDENVLYSTWCPRSYYFETISSPELALGTKKEYFAYGKIFDCDIKDLFIGLYNCGFEYRESTYSPQGFVVGHISTHEEVFTIRRYLSYGKYRPSVYFVYSPCDYAIRSVQNYKAREPIHMHLITKDEIVSGGESVGVIIQGNRFKTRYFGNYLKTEDIDESATIAQVSAGAFAAFVYMVEHPKKGMLFPEELDDKEILTTAKKFLKGYISLECPRISMNLGRGKN